MTLASPWEIHPNGRVSALPQSLWPHAPLVVYSVSCVQLLMNPWTVAPPGFSVLGISPGKNTGVGCHSFQGVFLTQGLNPGLLHWQVDSLPLSHLGSPHNSSTSIKADERTYVETEEGRMQTGLLPVPLPTWSGLSSLSPPSLLCLTQYCTQNPS